MLAGAYNRPGQGAPGLAPCEPMSARILSTGAYWPARRVSRAELEAAGLKVPRGHEEHRVAGPAETSVLMAERALQQAMNRAELDPREIDLVIAFSGMGDWDFPKDVVTSSSLG